MKNLRKTLTEKEILSMSKDERKILLEELEDLNCNIDHYRQTLLSEIVNRNIHKLESNLIHKEF